MLDARSKLHDGFFCGISRDGALCIQISFIADDHERERIRLHDHRLFEEAALPYLELVKRAAVSYIVHEEAAVGAAVEGSAEGLIALLASRVPDL